MRIAFLGSPEIGVIIFSDLLKSGIIFKAVITRPDKPRGRSSKPETTAVKKIALENNIKIYEPSTKEELTEIIKRIKPDLCIVAAYGMIIPNGALDVPKYGMINFHPSLLPELRGPAPIPMTIMCGDKKTGVSIIQISEKMDAGDILMKKEYKLNNTETTPELSEKLAHLGSKMIVTLIPNIIINKTSYVQQDSDKATYTKMITKEQGKIDWKLLDAKSIEQMSRAFTPWPGVYSYWNGKKIDFYDISTLDTNRSDLFEIGPTYLPGKIVTVDGKIFIGTKDGAISPGYLKLEGKNKVTAKEFLCGYPDFIGSELE